MNPSEELRTAAQKIRDTAGPATPGPWRDFSTAEDGVIPRYVTSAECEPGAGWPHVVVKVTDDVLGDGHEVVAAEDVAWIALAGPQLAEPLAGILDGAAALIGQHPDLAREHIDGEPCGSPHCQIVTHALAVARAVLGSAR